MYEVRLKQNTKKQFVALARRKMKAKGWSVADLAAAINRPVSTVYSFFSHYDRDNRFIAAEIAKALGINPKRWM